MAPAQHTSTRRVQRKSRNDLRMVFQNYFMRRWESREVVVFSFEFGFGGVVFWFGILTGWVLGFDLGWWGWTGFVWVVFGF